MAQADWIWLFPVVIGQCFTYMRHQAIVTWRIIEMETCDPGHVQLRKPTTDHLWP